MPLLIAVYIAIALISFSVIMIAVRPTRTDKAIERRISTISLPLENCRIAEAAAAQLLKPTRSSRIEWLEAVVNRFRASRRLHAFIDQAKIPISVGTLILTCAALFVVGFLITFNFHPLWPAALAAGALASCLPYGILAYERSKRLSAFAALLPEGIDLLGRALRAGHSMQAAIGMVASQSLEPLASEFAQVFQQQNFGLPLREALLHLLERIPSPDLRVLVTAIVVQRDTGGNLTEILDRTASVIRERIRIKAEIRIHTAQGRLTGWILSFLPVSMFFLINVVNPGYSHVMLVDPLGRKLLYAGIGLTAMGALVIRRIVNGIEV